MKFILKERNVDDGVEPASVENTKTFEGPGYVSKKNRSIAIEEKAKANQVLESLREKARGLEVPSSQELEEIATQVWNLPDKADGLPLHQVGDVLVSFGHFKTLKPSTWLDDRVCISILPCIYHFALLWVWNLLVLAGICGNLLVLAFICGNLLDTK